MIDAQTITLSSVVVQNASPLSADVAGRVVLMSIDRGNYYDLDAVSSDIWRRLAHPVSVSALCAALAEEYAGERSMIETDVLALLRKFAEQTLIDVVTLPS